VFVGFCVADEDWKAFDSGDAFPVWTHIYYVYFVFFPNFNRVIYAFAVFVFCVSWSSLFGTKKTFLAVKKCIPTA
jgi:hypothetical protein